MELPIHLIEASNKPFVQMVQNIYPSYFSSLRIPISAIVDVANQIEVDGTHVGELHELWQFPSDHLPIGAQIDDFRVVSWNVLNNAYMSWVYEDSQGLIGSQITELDVAVNEFGLTQRDCLVIDMLNEMIDNSNDILALQECGTAFLDELETRLPSHWQIVMSKPNAKDQNVILYNTHQFTYIPDKSTISFDAYPCQVGRPMMNIAFEKKDGSTIRIFNSHVPGNPDLPGRNEYAQYVNEQMREDELTIALGDMNFEREEMRDAFIGAGVLDFELYSPYRTNIDPDTKRSKAIDHILVTGNKSSRALDSKEILENLDNTITLLY